jgi:hypothetical protein
MDKKRIQEILGMFPAQKPVAFNYMAGRAAVLELIAALQSEEPGEPDARETCRNA